MGKYSRLGRNTLFVFLGNAGAKLIGFIMLPLYTRWLSVEGYGLADIITIYVTLAIGIVSCSIGESLFIFPKEVNKLQKKAYFSTALAFLAIMLFLYAVVFYFLSYWGVKYVINNSFFDNVWLIYGMTTCMLLQQVIQQFARSLDEMFVYSTTGIIVAVCTALFSFVFIPRYSVYGYVLSIDVAYALGALYSLIASGAFHYMSLKSISFVKCKEMLKYSIPLIPNGIMWWLVGALNRPLLEANVGLYGIGLFAVANKISGVVTMLFTMFSVSWQISVIEEYKKEGFQHFYNKVFRIVSFGLFFLFFAIALLSKWVVTLLTTPDYYDAWIYIPILLLGSVMSSLAAMGGTVYSAVKQSKYYFYSSLWSAIVAVIFNSLLIPAFGVLGSSISVVMSFLTMAISRVYYAWKYVHVERILKYVWMLILTIISITSVFIFDYLYYTLTNFILVAILFLSNWDMKSDIVLMLNNINKKILIIKKRI